MVGTFKKVIVRHHQIVELNTFLNKNIDKNNMWGRKPFGIWNRFRLQQYWKRNSHVRIAVYIFIALLFGLIFGKIFFGNDKSPQNNEPVYIPQEGKTTIIEKEVIKEVEKQEELYKINATKGYVIGNYGNNIQWDGLKVNPIKGHAWIKIDPKEHIGDVYADTVGFYNPHDNSILNGSLKIQFTHFKGEEEYQGNGVVEDILLFGGTGNGGDYFPATKAILAGWGRADILLDDQKFEQDLIAGFAITQGMRNENFAITGINESKYRPKYSNRMDFVDKTDRELHIWVHSRQQDNKNFPGYSFYINLYFEELDVLEVPKGRKI